MLQQPQFSDFLFSSYPGVCVFVMDKIDYKCKSQYICCAMYNTLVKLVSFNNYKLGKKKERKKGQLLKGKKVTKRLAFEYTWLFYCSGTYKACS